MKTRIVYTDFWREMVRMNAPKDARTLYHYLFTNEYINMSGVYALDDSYILLETGLTPNELVKAKRWLQENKKVLFNDGWIKIVNAEKRNNYQNSEKNMVVYQRELSSIPSSILAKFEATDSTIDTTIDSNHKLEIRNNKSKEGVVKGEFSSLSYLDILPDKDLEDFYLLYDTTKQQIQNKAKDLADYCRGHGKMYKDYKAMLSKALRKDFKLRPKKTDEIPLSQLITQTQMTN